jgi:DNA-binding NtrC family response regulator
MGVDGDAGDRDALVETSTHELSVDSQRVRAVRRFRVTVVEGPQTGLSWESSSDRCTIGSHPLNDLVLADPTVSRFHCEVELEKNGACIRDLKSRNGTLLDGVVVHSALLRNESTIRLGASVVKFTFANEHNRLPTSDKTQFGSMVGASFAMRATFSLLERAAASDSTILIEGETGTGKGGAAESLHRMGARRDGPLVVVDCGALPPNLLESELFGHEKGSFTGASARRVGAFEEASGGTIFLDEIGELPGDMQPKLLRALENREVRRVGANAYRPIDVRVIAATNRDLRAEVNRGQFRSDLYFRLAVLKITLPPLRQRPEDIPGLVDHICASLGAEPKELEALRTPELLAAVQRSAWPGNVRELRNYLERCLVFKEPLPVGDQPLSAEEQAPLRVDVGLPFFKARREHIDEFERRYLEEILSRHQGKVTQAATAAGVDRVHMYRLLRRHGLK